MNRGRVTRVLRYIKSIMYQNMFIPKEWDEMKLKILVIVFQYDKAIYLETGQSFTGIEYIKGWVPYPSGHYFEYALRKIFGDWYNIPREPVHAWHERMCQKETGQSISDYSDYLQRINEMRRQKHKCLK